MVVGSDVAHALRVGGVERRKLVAPELIDEFEGVGPLPLLPVVIAPLVLHKKYNKI